jgi:hypothetical protein
MRRSTASAPLDHGPAIQPDSYSLTAVARLRDGVTLTETRAELTGLGAALEPIAPGNGNTAIFTLIDAVLLKALPVREPARSFEQPAE